MRIGNDASSLYLCLLELGLLREDGVLELIFLLPRLGPARDVLCCLSTRDIVLENVRSHIVLRLCLLQVAKNVFELIALVLCILRWRLARFQITAEVLLGWSFRLDLVSGRRGVVDQRRLSRVSIGGFYTVA